MTEHKVTMESTLKALLEKKKYSTLKDILVTVLYPEGYPRHHESVGRGGAV